MSFPLREADVYRHPLTLEKERAKRGRNRVEFIDPPLVPRDLSGQLFFIRTNRLLFPCFPSLWSLRISGIRRLGSMPAPP